ncbi:MAG: c-type cytochrome [Myxococcales bacterium]|jgi:mono/diheme cytochrome c family protein
MDRRQAARLLLPFALLLSPALPARAEPAPAERYRASCAGCHTLGEGDRAGPDLLGVTRLRDRAWLEQMIRRPSALFDRSDPLAAELLARFGGSRMPDQPMSDEELEQLIEYLDECSSRGGCRVTAERPHRGSEASVSEMETGRLLFEGRRSFKAGGLQCSACHDVRGTSLAGGGTLATDLTLAYARLGDEALARQIEKPANAAMAYVYRERPLADDESFRLRAYLASTAREGAPPAADHAFPVIALFGLALSLTLLRVARRRPPGRAGGGR